MNSIKNFATKNRTVLNITFFALTIAGLAAMDKVPGLSSSPFSIIVGIVFAVIMVKAFRSLDAKRIAVAAKK